MRRCILIPLLCLACTSVAQGHGLLIPVEPDLPPLAMLNHHVDVSLEDQVATTRVSQTFRNHTDRRLEATYVFPVPAGASVRDFAMWVGGRRVKGELLRSDKANDMYTSIVRQTKNPALLEYIGTDLLTLKVFPVPPQGDQKVEVSFTAVARKEKDLIEYVYPLKTDLAAPETLEEFRLTLNLKSQQPLGSIYSPSHSVTINQADNHEAIVQLDQANAKLDRDFKLFYTNSGQDVGLTALKHRPVSSEDGYAMLLVSPRADLSDKQRVPRDIVFVVDTSGSMMEEDKLKNAKKAMRHCLDGLSPEDRFGLINFATTVNRYRDKLVLADEDHIKRAKGWVADLYAGGGTAIHQALNSALEMRTDDSSRMFTVVFFTDGQPTIGEIDTEKILSDITADSTGNTRIFSLGLGDDLDAVFLDQIAEQTRAVSRYIRPKEDLEAKVTAFFDKIRHPVLSNLKLSTEGDVQLAEVYPPQLPDLFHGDQLVVLARYNGSGPADVVLDGKIGEHEKQFTYEVEFQSRTDEKQFVEELWARRKVGYLLDQIRVNGEKKELVDEVVHLAQRYGITTPYTSYLIMPDAPLQVAAADTRTTGHRQLRPAAPPALEGQQGAGQARVEEFAKRASGINGQLAKSRDKYQDAALDAVLAQAEASPAQDGDDQAEKLDGLRRLRKTKELKTALDRAEFNFRRGDWRQNQVNKLGVDLAICTNELKSQSQLHATAMRRVVSRNCMEIGGVWIDESFNDRTPTLAIRAQSDAYFQILEQQPQMKSVFGLGNHVVWIAPNGTALVIDTTDGKERRSSDP